LLADELRDHVGEPLGLVDRDERSAVGDPLQASAGDLGLQALGELDLEDPIVGRPRE
jgi:hypothetical protein